MSKTAPDERLTGSGSTREASPWVMRFIVGVPPGGTLLDLACGGGRHIRAGLAAGLDVLGIDRDLSRAADLAGRPGVRLIAADLEAGDPLPLEGVRFAGVVVTNYLWRPILPDILAAVARDGILIYETFALGNQRFGKPSNPDFLLRPGELLEAVAADGALTPIAYEHVTLVKPQRVVQRVVAVGPDHPWRGAPTEAG